MNRVAVTLLSILLLPGGGLAQGDEAPTPALPAGIEEEVILGALVPEHPSRSEAWKRCKGREEDDDCSWNDYSLGIVEVLETSLGIEGQKVLAVATEGRDGRCNQCYSMNVGVFSLPSGSLVYRFGGVGHLGPANLREFTPPDGSGSTLLQFDGSEGSRGGWMGTTRYWLRPSIVNGALTFDEVWSGLIEYVETSRDLIHGASRGTATLEWSSKGRFKQVLHMFYGGECDCPASEAGDGCSEVEIRQSTPWALGPDGKVFPAGRLTIERIDHCESEVFPFSLPVRRRAYVPASAPGPVSGGSLNGPRRVPSPTGRYAIQLGTSYWDPLILERKRDGKVLRSVRLSQPPNFCGEVRGIGWANDESRFFAAIEFGPDSVALLSFSVHGERDFWENLSAGPDEYRGDGFLMSRPSRRHERSKTGGGSGVKP